MNQTQIDSGQQSESDVFGFNLRPQNSSLANKEPGNNNDESKPKIKFDPKELYYDMTGEKYLVIFNHYEYDINSNYYRKEKKPPLKRKGTDEDVKSLEETFEKLGFSIKTYHDKHARTIWDILLELRSQDFRSASCLCIVFLTHGNDKNELFAYDRPHSFNHVTKLFESHPTLTGKPKLFFVQACRGVLMDDGSRIEIDGPEDDNTFVMPSHADFLVARSTVEDHVSYRDCRGSWLIQELCKAAQEYSDTLDILQIMTIVHQKVAYGYKTYSKKQEYCNKVQMPETSFTLTKILKFKP